MNAAQENAIPTARPAGDRAGAVQPAACTARISQVRGRWVRLRRLLAVSLLIAWTASSMTAAILLDAWWRGGHASRAALLAIVVILIAWIVRRVVRPLWSPLSFDEAALLLERTYPDLSGRLMTAVQLADASRRARNGASSDLYEIVCGTAEESAHQLNAATAVPGRPALRRSAAAWVLVAALLILAGFNRASTSIGISRLLLPWHEINWPKRTRIELTGVDDHQPIRVVRGGTLTLAGRASGVVPSTGVLRVHSATSDSDRAYFDIAADGAFSVRYRPVMRDLHVSLEIGDATAAGIRVEMVPPPEIVSVQAECTYPDYTGLPAQSVEDGNVQAVFGTGVKLRVAVNKTISEAKLAWESGQPMTMTLNEQEAEVAFAVQASQSYRIHLTDALGFHNADPVVYRIEMVDNQYPQFERVTPLIDRRVTPQAGLPITAEISDDYGVTQVSLCFRKGNAAAEHVEIPLERPGKRAVIQYLWALEPLGVKPGETITYWLEARDAGEHAAKHDWPISRLRKLKIMSEVELARALNDEIEQIMDKLARLESLQAECSDTVTRISSSIGTERETTVQERTRAEKWRQDRIARTAGQLGESLARVADDYATSRIGQEDRWQQRRQTAERLSRLAGTDMPAILLALDEALNSLQGKRPPATRPAEERK